MFNPEKPPELQVTQWLNAKAPITLAGLKGRVVVVTAFQMLCPGCVSHGLPQAKKLVERFASNEVAVIGLHSVFEHHDVMTPAALAAFVHEYRWPFAIGIDTPDGKDLPKTMAAYEMRGTPTLLLFDRQGRLRRHYLGQVDDIRLSAEVMGLAIEDAKATREDSINIERRLAAALIDPEAAQNHEHGHDHGDDCGCGHDHADGHGHNHDHAHDGSHDHGDVAKPAAKPTKGKR
jgi:AhpC/TSA family